MSGTNKKRKKSPPPFSQSLKKGEDIITPSLFGVAALRKIFSLSGIRYDRKATKKVLVALWQEELPRLKESFGKDKLEALVQEAKRDKEKALIHRKEQCQKTAAWKDEINRFVHTLNQMQQDLVEKKACTIYLRSQHFTGCTFNIAPDGEGGCIEYTWPNGEGYQSTVMNFVPVQLYDSTKSENELMKHESTSGRWRKSPISTKYSFTFTGYLSQPWTRREFHLQDYHGEKTDVDAHIFAKGHVIELAIDSIPQKWMITLQNSSSHNHLDQTNTEWLDTHPIMWTSLVEMFLFISTPLSTLPDLTVIKVLEYLGPED